MKSTDLAYKNKIFLCYFRNLSERNLLMLRNYAVTHPSLSYGIELWKSAACTQIRRVFILQQKCVGLNCNLKSIEYMFINNNFCTVYSPFAYKVICYAANKEQLTNSQIYKHNTLKQLSHEEFHQKNVKQGCYYYGYIII